MGEVVAKAGITREKGYLYFIDKEGDISRSQMSRGATKSKGSEKVSKVSVAKESGYLYYVDKNGDVARAKMSRGRK